MRGEMVGLSFGGLLFLTVTFAVTFFDETFLAEAFFEETFADLAEALGLVVRLDEDLLARRFPEALFTLLGVGFLASVLVDWQVVNTERLIVR